MVAMVGTIPQTLLSLLYSLFHVYLGFSYGSEVISDFRLLHEGSVCSGQKLTYECIIDGTETSVATVWSGTAFNCPGTANQISLRHSEFENGSAVGVCNSINGELITARGIRRTNYSFISHLTIIVDTSLVGNTIQCADDDGLNNYIVGNHTINVTEEGCGEASTRCNNESKQVPESPVIRDVHCYCNMNLISININQSEPFNIPDGVNESVISYNITYFDFTSNNWIYKTSTPFSCDNWVCNIHIKIQSCPKHVAMSNGSIPVYVNVSNLLRMSASSNHTVFCNSENTNSDDEASHFTAIIIATCLLLTISAEIFMIVVVSIYVVIKRK